LTGSALRAQNCHTDFLTAARQTKGLDFLVQAIQRGHLQGVLPAAGSGATVFAPNNAAFTSMLQALSEFPPQSRCQSMCVRGLSCAMTLPVFVQVRRLHPACCRRSCASPNFTPFLWYFVDLLAGDNSYHDNNDNNGQ
jgi:hypothetical protein